MNLPFPTRMYESPADITAQQLRQLGVRALLLDIDGTLARTREPMAQPSVLNWIEEMRKEGFLLYILSNNKHPQRVKRFAEKIGTAWTHLAHKPRRSGFYSAAQALGVPPSQCAVVGDQIFTDMLGARRCGMKGLLVKSTDTDLWYFYPRRLLELPFMRVRKQHES